MKTTKYIDIAALAVGTKFRVINGDWFGEIIERKGKKYIKNKFHEISIEKASELIIEELPQPEEALNNILGNSVQTYSDRDYYVVGDFVDDSDVEVLNLALAELRELKKKQIR
jgi:hypothetical protein